MLLGLAEAAAATIGILAVTAPAAAQLDDRFPFLEDRRRRYQQQRALGLAFGFPDQPRQQPVEFLARARAAPAEGRRA